MYNMKSKMKIVEIGFYICLFLYGIIIGAPINENTYFLNLMINIITIVLFAINLIYCNKSAIKNNIIDLLITILVFSSFIPIIFKTYYSYYEAANYVIKYISIFCVYIIVRNLICINGKKVIINIINILIITAIILTMIGILDMFPNNSKFNDFMKLINAIQIKNTEIRMDSVFGYANTFAAFLGVCLFMSSSLYLKENNNKKILYLITNFIFLVALLLTASRLAIICFIISYLFFLIAIKEKYKKIEFVIMSFNILIMAIIYNKIYLELLIDGKYILVFIIMLIFIIINCIIQKILKNVINKLVNIESIYLIIFLILLVIIGIIYIVCSLHFYSELILFSGISSSKTYTKVLYNIESNKKYNFSFDIEAITNTENIENFKISIIEKNKYFDEIKTTDIKFNNYSGEKEITIITDDDTEQIYIEFSANIVNNNTMLIIKNAKNNDENLILNYKYIPTMLAEKIQNINFKTKSAWERIVIINDGIKLICKNPFVGIGGGCWKYAYQEVQEYRYLVKEMHSYPVQIFLEFGIVSIISYIVIIVLSAIYSFKIIKKNEKFDIITGIIISLFYLTIHSFMDFNLSFLYVLIIYYILIACIVPSNKEHNNVLKKINIFVIINSILILVIFAFLNLTYGIAEKIENVNDENGYKRNIEILDKKLLLSPYDKINRIEKIRMEELYLNINRSVEIENALINDYIFVLYNEPGQNNIEIYEKLILLLLEQNKKEEAIKYLNIFIDEINKQNQFVYYNVQYYITKLRTLEKIERKLQEYEDDSEIKKIKEELINIVNNNAEKELNIIKDYKKCRYKKNEIKFYLTQYNAIMFEILN